MDGEENKNPLLQEIEFGAGGIFILFFLLLFPIGGFSLGDFMFSALTYARSLLLP